MKSGELLGLADPALTGPLPPCPVCGSPVIEWNDADGHESLCRCGHCAWSMFHGFGNFEELIGVHLFTWNFRETEQGRQARRVERANVLNRVRAEVCPCYTSS